MTCQISQDFPFWHPFCRSISLQNPLKQPAKNVKYPLFWSLFARALFYDGRHTLGKPSGTLHGNWIPSAFTAAGTASGGGEACPWIFFSEYDIQFVSQAKSLDATQSDLIHLISLVLHLNQKVHTAFTLKIEEENYKRSRRNMLCMSVLQYCEVNNDQQDEMS